MSYHIPFRTFARSPKARINGVQLQPTQSAWVNVDSPRVQRDLARHAAIGQVLQVGDGLGFTSDGYLLDGAAVTKTAVGSLNLTVSQGRVVRSVANGSVQVAVPATTTLAVGANTTTPAGARIDVVAIDTTSGAAVVVPSPSATGTANANLFNRLGLIADLPANRIPIALVSVPSGAANLDAATIVPLR